MTKLTLDEERIVRMNQEDLHQYVQYVREHDESEQLKLEKEREEAERDSLLLALKRKMIVVIQILQERKTDLKTLHIDHSDHYHAISSLNQTIKDDLKSTFFQEKLSLKEVKKYDECLDSVKQTFGAKEQYERDMGYLKMAQNYDDLTERKKEFPNLTTDNRKSIKICMGLAIAGMFVGLTMAILATSPLLMISSTVALAVGLGGFGLFCLATAVGLTRSVRINPNLSEEDKGKVHIPSRCLRNSFGLFPEVRDIAKSSRDYAPSAPPEEQVVQYGISYA